ncbi:MAG: extracellular solute-binding protein [Actinomycetota bacterium]|nr:extracellular solute-binding protein [Actinomycetota bacterium]
MTSATAPRRRRWMRGRLVPALVAGAGVAALVGAGVPLAGASTTTLTVWLMTGEITAKVYDAVNQAFEAQHPGVTVNVQIQQWSGITTKLNTSLASSSPPDATEIGNTDVPEYAASGGLVNLKSLERSISIGSGKWLGGLQQPAEYKGGVYGVPLLAGDRVVLYNETMFQKAGIKSPPKSESQLLADGKKLEKANKSTSNFSALYFPGKYWYAAMSMVWDHGGKIAAPKHGKWVAQLASKKSLAGLDEFRTVQHSLSVPASRTANTTLPTQDAVFAKGQAAMIIGGDWEVAAIEKDNAALTGHIGEFAFPSYKGGPAPVFLGGSDIAVAKNSPNKALAEDWVKLMTSNKYQTMMYKDDNLIPNNTSLSGLGKASPVMATYLEAAKKSQGTPAAPGWAVVTGGNQITTFFSNVAQASSPKKVAALAKSFDSYLNTALNQP